MKLTIQLLAAFFTVTTGLFAGPPDCATPDKVSLQLKWVPQAQFAGYYAALDLSYYKEECLEVTIRPGGLDLEPEEVVDLLLQHKVDAAAAMAYNELAQVLETVNPTTGNLYQSSDLNVIDFNEEKTAMLEDRIMVAEDWIKSARNQDIAVRFLRASIKGWIYCRDHPDDALRIVLKNAPTLGKSHQAWQLNEVNRLIWPSPQGIGMMNDQRWLETAKISHRYGVTKSLPDRSAYTNEFVKKALDSLKNIDTKGLDWKPKIVTLLGRGQ